MPNDPALLPEKLREAIYKNPEKADGKLVAIVSDASNFVYNTYLNQVTTVYWVDGKGCGLGFLEDDRTTLFAIGPRREPSDKERAIPIPAIENPICGVYQFNLGTILYQ
ncbi:MAG TPA: hypothetical protein VJB90_01770 [Candidatus Nanoarchaeia archaeon]|nr:hypothetical protein [Candidatus Nanoarchaeia archaeon]